MVEKITKYKKYIISVAIILVLAILFMNIKYLLPKKYGKIPEVKLIEIEDTRTFAIMIPNKSGDGTESNPFILEVISIASILKH